MHSLMSKVNFDQRWPYTAYGLFKISFLLLKILITALQMTISFRPKLISELSDLTYLISILYDSIYPGGLKTEATYKALETGPRKETRSELFHCFSIWLRAHFLKITLTIEVSTIVTIYTVLCSLYYTECT